jgi:hypothetical protein
VPGADAHIEQQLAMNRVTWEALGEAGVKEGAELQLDFLFYAPGEAEARALAAQLDSTTDYQVEAASEKRGLLSKRQWLVRGSTQPIAVSLQALDEWVERMVAVGAAHECGFDGWGAAVPDA